MLDGETNDMKKPVLYAHRGFSYLYPENSPLAFKMAAEAGADGIESDVHISKDGKLVIFHDAVLERTSDGKGYIKDYTYEELLQLDIGSWKSPAFAGQHIWTLSQLLDFCRETGLLLNLELKNYEVFYEGLEERVIHEITSRHMEKQVTVSSFNHISMQNFKRLNPVIETGLLYDKPYLDMEAYISRSNADNMHPRYMLMQYQRELVSLYHDHGMKVVVWTVDEPDDIRDMVNLGADAIISNRIDILIKTVSELCGDSSSVPYSAC